MKRPSVFKDPSYKKALQLLYNGLKRNMTRQKKSYEDVRKIIY